MTLKQQLRKLTLPIFIDIALVQLLGVVDTAMLSRYSDDAVAAVGLDNQLMSLIFLVYQFISMGAAILCAQYIGAKLQKRLVQIVGISLVINTAIGMLVSALLFLFAIPILEFMGLREALMADGLIYLQITGALSFSQALSLTFSASLRSADRTTGPMLVTLFSNILNILGNYALIFGHWGCPAMGVEGCAWATALSRLVAMLMLAMLHTRIHIKSYPLKWFFPFPWQELRNLLYIGIPAMSEELSYGLSQVTITYFINQISTEALVTRTYCWSVIVFVFLFCTSVTQGGDILVGHLVGQQRYRASYILGNYFLRWSMLITICCSLLLALGGGWVLQQFTSNENVIRLGTWVFIIDVFLEIGRVRNIFACGTLRAAGDAVYPVIIGVIFQWTVAVMGSWLLGIPLGLGLIGMWIGFALDENLRGIILLHRWHSKRWMGKSFAV